MKNSNKILSLLLGSVLLAGCNDLDTEIEGRYTMAQQKTETTKADPSMILASVTGITANFSTYMTVSSTHNDFGYPAVMLFLDSRGTDLVGLNTGYNWFNTGNALSDCNVNSYTSVLSWRHLYNQIFTANALLSSVGSESEDPATMFYIAQAQAIRAFDYFQLAQIFQFTYDGHQQESCVPIITEANAAEAAANGCPRATVEAVYAQILADLNAAIDNLANSGINPSRIIDDKPKRLVSLATAYGLRARVNLVMHNWADAAADARSAISSFSGAPYSMAAVAKPSFCYLSDASWMWGIAIAETDRVVTSGIVNWPSHLGSLNYGYASVGAWRKIAINLYNSIPVSDVRRGWFLDANSESVNLSEAQQAYVEGKGMPAYTQVKFAPYNDVLGQSTSANDVPLMRVEEMYLIEAEATAMGGNPTTAAQMLTDFVVAYRNPEYVCSATTADEVREACWQQRRVEFWGEGISFFDIMRLKKGVDRRGGGWEAVWVYNVPAEADVLRLPIPNSEVQGNPLLGENNPTAEKPSQVADE